MESLSLTRCSALFLLVAAAPAALPQSSQPMITVTAPPAPPAATTSAPKVIEGSCLDSEYPNAARRSELEGTTRTRFDVDESGRVVGMLLVKSSGHDSLDAATLASQRTCQFNPGAYNGKPRLSSAFIDLKWTLDSTRGSQPTAHQ